MGDFGKDSGLGGCPQLEALSLGQQPRAGKKGLLGEGERKCAWPLVE